MRDLTNDALMMDQTTMAYINLYAIFGAIPKLCMLDASARELIEKKKIKLGFKVNGGPEASLLFDNGKCTFLEGTDGCDILLPFKSPEKFNGMINGTVTPFPSKGITKIKFLLGEFTKLTDILTKYLRASEEDLQDKAFFETSTRLMLSVIAGAAAQIGNHDKVGKHSASYIVDGIVKLSIKDLDAAYVSSKDHFLSVVNEEPKSVMARMEFEDMYVARDLFDGKVNAAVCVGMGLVRIGGMISMVDNINRMLDRVSVYLA